MPQIAPAELEARVESYISSMWMSDAASSLMLEAKGDSYRGRPKEAAEAERTAMHAVEESNGMADAERVRACCNNFVRWVRSFAVAVLRGFEACPGLLLWQKRGA